MSDDDASDHGAPPDPSRGGGLVEPVVLPEHASAYYSPRSPPAVTSHQTIETAAVAFNASLDPRLADTHRVSVDGLEPPPWLGGGSAPISDAPTVLIPVVRVRRFRRRMIAGAAVAVAGAALGVWFGLTGEQYRRVPESVEARAGSAPEAVPTTKAVPNLLVPFSSAGVPAVAPSATASSVAPSVARLGVSRGTSRRALASSSAWFKAEPPRAWIK